MFLERNLTYITISYVLWSHSWKHRMNVLNFPLLWNQYLYQLNNFVIDNAIKCIDTALEQKHSLKFYSSQYLKKYLQLAMLDLQRQKTDTWHQAIFQRFSLTLAEWVTNRREIYLPSLAKHCKGLTTPLPFWPNPLVIQLIIRQNALELMAIASIF